MINKQSYNPFFVLEAILSDMRIKTGLLICCLLFTSFYAKADDEETIYIELSPIISFDEVPVDFNVNGYLRFETDVIITESNKVYINIEELFRNLGIKCVSENDGNYLSGFVENESKTYSIDFNKRQIKIGIKTYHSENGIVQELGAIYVDAILLTEAFGLNTMFNFRSLSVKMDADFELPLIKQMRLEQMRENVSKLQNQQIVADTIIKRDYHFLKFGMMDWFLASFQALEGITNNRIALGAGAELLYGQVNVSAYYDEKQGFDKRNFYYNWRWVDNEKSIIRQAQVGKIFPQSIAFIDAPVVGASISNTPTTVRKASGHYTINEYTEPNWTVELYINDVLVDYTVADASGLFVFKVPIVYGFTTIKLKFYGPLGEERIEERTKNVPFTFMPAQTLEYKVSGGMLQDKDGSRFGKGVVNYGINNFITIGGGMEYLSSISNSPFIPFATLAIQPFSKMVLNFEYSHNVRTRGLLNYYFGKSAFLEIDYADYVDGQMATRFNANEELKVRLSLPFKLKKVSGYAKLNYQRFVYNAFSYNYFDAVLSGYYKKFNANLSTLVNWVSNNDPYITSNLSLSYRMRNGFIIRPSAEYNISNQRLSRYRVEVEKRVSKANFSIYYEKDMLSKTDNVYLSFRFDLPFARAGISASYNNNNFYLSESAEGSLAFGGDNNYIKAGNTSSLGKGGIMFYPFLDLNQNGIFDEDEHLVLLSSVKVSGGRAFISEKDSIVRITDLNSFVNYIVEFNDNDLENIGWYFKHKIYQVLVDPNQFKRVDVPIVVMGEASGTVYLQQNEGSKGIGRMSIQIFNQQGKKVAETLSESDGYISYLGLKPGNYTACLDSVQLQNLNFNVSPLCREFTIKTLEDGDIVEGLDFVLSKKPISIDTIQNMTFELKQSKKQNEEQIQNEKIDPVIPASNIEYRVQICAVFDVRIEEEGLARKYNLKQTIKEDFHNRYYIYSVGSFTTFESAYKYREELIRVHKTYDAFVVKFIDGKRVDFIKKMILTRGVNGAYIISYIDGGTVVALDPILPNIK